jgi:hypothetical protein
MQLSPVGAVSIAGVIVSAILLVLLWPNLAIVLFSAVFGFAAFAYASFRRPHALKDIISWGKLDKHPANLAQYIQNRGMVTGVRVYFAALGAFVLVLVILGPSQFFVACLVALPIALLGAAIFVSTIILRIQAERKK